MSRDSTDAVATVRSELARRSALGSHVTRLETRELSLRRDAPTVRDGAIEIELPDAVGLDF